MKAVLYIFIIVNVASEELKPVSESEYDIDLLRKLLFPKYGLERISYDTSVPTAITTSSTTKSPLLDQENLESLSKTLATLIELFKTCEVADEQQQSTIIPIAARAGIETRQQSTSENPKNTSEGLLTSLLDVLKGAIQKIKNALKKILKRE